MKSIIKGLKICLAVIIAIVLLVILLFGHSDIPLDELKAKYAQTPSSFISVDGMDVHFRDEGDPNDSVPIVLIHGIGASLHTFDDWTNKLRQNYRIIRLDMPAYGLTGPFAHRDYTIENYTNFLHNFLTALGIQKCILGGNSLGGGIAWRYTVQHPDMVERLILIDAVGYPATARSEPLAFKVSKIPVLKEALTYITPRFVAKGSLENVYADKTKVTDELVDRYFELTLRAGNRQAFIDKFKTKSTPDAYKKIRQIQQPTLILWGDQDKLIPVSNAHRFHKDLPNDTLVILKNTGHVPMEESPNKSLDVVLAFLESSWH